MVAQQKHILIDDIKLGQVVIKVDPKYYRPTEVELLIGDSTKAKKQLNWEPKTNINDMVHIMVQNDIKLLEQKYAYTRSNRI